MTAKIIPLGGLPPMPARPPSASAARQGRYKQRQRQGDVTVTLTLSQSETATLHQAGCLDIDRLEDRAAIVEGIHLLLGNFS
jgi:hypothetical protein